MLEAGEQYSLRAVARRAGVSPTAPYRHFADRAALDSAVAIGGFEELREQLGQALEETDPVASYVDVLATLGVAYVRFALRHPALFRLMFGEQYDDEDSDRVQASQQLHALLGEVLTRILPGPVPPGLATALWGLAHGHAFLHLDGKYRQEPEEEVAARVRTAVAAVLAVGVELRADDAPAMTSPSRPRTGDRTL
jgi:AcrR family transcriptional regulator